MHRWVQRSTSLLTDAARLCRHSPGSRWFVDDTYVKVNGLWRYVCGAVDQRGHVIDVLVSTRRDGDAARRLLKGALTTLTVMPSRLRTGLSPGARRGRGSGLASRRALRQQRYRSRPRPAQTPAATDARPTYQPHRSGRHHRAGVYAEPAATTNWPPRVRASCASPPRPPSSYRRSELQTHPGFTMPAAPTTHRCPPRCGRGPVALLHRSIVDRAGCDGEALNAPASGAGIALCVCWFPVPVRGDRGGGALVSAVRPVLMSSGRRRSGRLLVVGSRRRVSTRMSWTLSPDGRSCPCRLVGRVDRSLDVVPA